MAAQPFWENGASLLWVILATGLSAAVIINAIKGTGRKK